MKPHRLAWGAGIVGLALSHYWLVAKIEPFYSSIYCFLWWSYILTVDCAVCLLQGSSLLRDRPKELLFLSLWSVPLWLLYEMVNLRIHNWFYVMAPRFWWGLAFMVLAFATVLPGIFETTELVLALIKKAAPAGKIAGRCFSVSNANLSMQLALGVVMLALMLLCPRNCFCLAWGFAYFLTDPICYWMRRKDKDHVGRSLLGQLASGDNTRLVALLVAGLICGGLWEAWNFGARTKWIYSVPFFDELKLGEMPVLGFFGFPPFALNCYTIVNFLSLFRDGRNWEFTRSENRARAGMPAWGVATCAVLLPIGVLAASFAVLTGGTIASYSEPLDWYFHSELGVEGMKALQERDAEQGNLFLRLKSRPPEISPALYKRMRRVTQMSELKGMGYRNALALEKLKIVQLEDLAAQNPADLARKLMQLRPPVRLEEVKIWIREAQRRIQYGKQTLNNLSSSITLLAENSSQIGFT
jgi:hypothetical protein